MKLIEELDIELCVLEIRFNPAFLLWDATGAIWTSMLQISPQLKLSTVLPNQQVFETDSLQLVLELGLLRVNGRGPNAIDEVTKNGSALTKIASERLRISSFSRVGFRVIRSKAFSSSASAMKFASLDDTRKSKAFGDDGTKTAFSASGRYEAEKAGLAVGLKAEEREWSFNTPWESRHHLPPILSNKEWVVVADSDYYTIGMAEKESFDVATWISQAQKAVQLHWSES